MLNFGEYPNVENASTLSAILEMDVPDKYFLSAKACWGIIRRAESRQKEMSDNARYMALGNSIAVPCAERVFIGINKAESEENEA